MAHWLNNPRFFLSGWVSGDVPAKTKNFLASAANTVKDAVTILEESGAANLIRLKQLRAIVKILSIVLEGTDFESSIASEVKTLALRTLHSANRAFNSKRYSSVAALRNASYDLIVSSEYDDESRRFFDVTKALANEIDSIQGAENMTGSLGQIYNLLGQIVAKLLTETKKDSEYSTAIKHAVVGIVSKYFRVAGANAARYEIAAEFRENPNLLPPVVVPDPSETKSKKRQPAPSRLWDAMQNHLPDIISFANAVIARLKKKKKELDYGYLYVAGEKIAAGSIFNIVKSDYSGFSFRYVQSLSDAGIINELKEMAEDIQADIGSFSKVHGFVVNSEMELDSAYEITNEVVEMSGDRAEQFWETTIFKEFLAFANGEI